MKYRHGVYIDNGHGAQIYQGHLVEDDDGDVYTLISRGYSNPLGCKIVTLSPCAGGRPFDVPATDVS